MFLSVLVKAILVLGYETKRTEAVNLFFGVVSHDFIVSSFHLQCASFLTLHSDKREYSILLICITDWFFLFSTKLPHISKRDAESKSDIIPCNRHEGRATAFLVAALCIFGIIQTSEHHTSNSTNLDIGAVLSGFKQWKENSGVD